MTEPFDVFDAPQYMDFESNEHDDNNVEEYFERNLLTSRRKSMSIGNLILFSEDDVCMANMCEPIIEISDTSDEVNVVQQTSRYQERSLYKRCSSLENIRNQNKFVSLAEQVEAFQKKTPARYHSKANMPPPRHEPLKLTIPQSPALLTKKRKGKPTNVLCEKNEKVKQDQCKDKGHMVKKTVTKPQPFTFDKQINSVMQRRQNLMDKIIAEENRARQFHARPIPANIKLKTSETCSIASSKKSTSTESITPRLFKAKSPKVLCQEPFKPVLTTTITQCEPFLLSYDWRASKREEFKRMLMEKEQQMAYIRALAEEEKRRVEQEQKNKFRELTNFKAQPVKKYKPLVIKHSEKVTVPVSPNFHHRNKENKC